MTNSSSSPPGDVRYVSLRWRLLLPVFAVVLAVALIGAFLVSRGIAGGGADVRAALLQNNAQAVRDRIDAYYAVMQDAAGGFLRFPEGRDALIGGSAERLQRAVENYARLAVLDALFVSNTTGLQGGVILGADGSYQPATDFDIGSGRYFTLEVPLTDGTTTVGSALVGVASAHLLEEARGSSAVELVIAAYSPQGAMNAASSPTFTQPDAEITSGGQAVGITLDGVSYLASRLTTRQALDVSIYMQADPPVANDAARQLIVFTLAIVAAGVAVSFVLIVTLVLERINKVRTVAERLAAGEVTEATGMLPTDEIGALGYALDRYAARVQARQEELRGNLRRQRRELEHFNAMIESLPDGIIVQDIDSNVTFINDRARQLVGERYNFFKRASERDITAAVVETLGGMIAPGILSKGSPQRIDIDGRVLSIQSAAIRSVADRQIGTVMIVRDVTADAQREHGRAALIDQVMAELGLDEADAAATPYRDSSERASSDGAAAFAQEARRREIALGKLLVGLRDLTNVDSQVIRRAQRTISLEMLVHAAANEWRAVASAANLTLDAIIEQNGLTVIGDERRLRWAIGNLLDNAIKYTPPGGKVTLEIKGAEGGYARLRVRDNGVGISLDDLPRIFDRFYRGDPQMSNGRRIQMPGAGLGLPIARDIIEAHGGLITVRSTPGVGTAVYFTLPLEGTPIPTVSPTPEEALEEDENITVHLHP